MDGQSRAELRVRLYSMCSWCAGLIDRQQRKQPQQVVQPKDLLLHIPDQHGSWLEILGIADKP